MQDFRNAVISLLPGFADSAPPLPREVRYRLLLLDENQPDSALALRLIPLSPTVGQASLQMMEAMAETRSPAVAALISAWCTLLDPYESMVSACIASYGRQELYLEAFLRHPQTQKIIPGGTIEVGAVSPIPDLLHSAINLGLVDHSRTG